jgi:hypothetical protein
MHNFCLTPEAVYLAAASPPMIILHHVIPHPGFLWDAGSHELALCSLEQLFLSCYINPSPSFFLRSSVFRLPLNFFQHFLNILFGNQKSVLLL